MNTAAAWVFALIIWFGVLSLLAWGVMTVFNAISASYAGPQLTFWVTIGALWLLAVLGNLSRGA